MNETMDLIEGLRRAAGLPAEASAQVRITGGDPVLRTAYKVAETGAASIAAAGMAAAWLWQQATGERQEVGVDATAAAAAMQSYKFMKLDGQPPGPVMDRMTGYYRVKDGRWVYLHCNFPNLALKNCEVLGAQPTPESLALCAADWNGAALEEAIALAGGCGALVRSEEEWRTHPQGLAAAVEPPLEILRIGDAPPEPLPAHLSAALRPLAGVRVLDMTRVLAGPTCGKTLAEHGAEVLRISAPHLPDSGVLDLDTGLGKLSASLDLRDAAQMEVLRDLVRGCDVFSQAYRPGSLDGRGLSPSDLATLRPGIVVVVLNAWGFTGPWRRRRGYDTVVQAANGMAWPDGADRPAGLPVAVQDYVAGYLMACGAMAALSRRVSEGGSWVVRVSLAACGEWIRSHGRVLPQDFERCPVQVPDAIVQPWLAQSASPAGLLTHLGSVTRMSRTPPRWARPLVPTGSSPARWPASSPT
jgi:crotonobetainyl-CoA:carnitine CoA-transferase CaiB-like acyl-CoA transferase